MLQGTTRSKITFLWSDSKTGPLLPTPMVSVSMSVIVTVLLEYVMLCFHTFKDYCGSCMLLKELLMSGLPEVDPDDWQANTEYSGDGYTEDHPVIKVTALLEYLSNV